MFNSKKGFTIIEALMTLGVLSIAASIAVPMYRQYLVRSDLEIARQNVSQGIQRARFLSQVGMNDSEWGFSTDAVPGRGVLFMGPSFVSRNSDFDELYMVADTVRVTGVTEVTFSRVDGIPSVTGDIVLTSLTGDERRVTISIGEDGNVSIPEDWLSVCFDPYGINQQTIQIPDSLWEEYQDRGSLLGDCSQINQASSSSSSSVAGAVPFIIDGKEVLPSIDYTCQLTILGTWLEYGDAYNMPITMELKEGTSWKRPFGDYSKPVDSNINTGSPQTIDCEEDDIDANKPINLRAKSWAKKQNWYDGTQNNHWNAHITINSITSMPNTANVEVLKNGDTIPSYPALQSVSTLRSYVIPYLNMDTGKVDIGADQALYLLELGTTDLDSSAADFQDMAILLTLYPA